MLVVNRWPFQRVHALSSITTTPKPFCFVLMPFDAKFDDVYLIGIKEACIQGGAYCERVDEQIFVESMLDRIYNQIAKADFIVADMSGRNANVFYEVGYAHALGKRTILLTQQAEDIPFDLKHFPHIVYQGGISKLRDELTKRVRWHVENPISTSQDSRIDIEIYHNKQPLSGNVVIPFEEGDFPIIELSVHNSSSQVVERDQFQIGVVLPPPFGYVSPCETIALMPDGNYLAMISQSGRLLPGVYSPISVTLEYIPNKPNIGDLYPITVRVFTPSGSRDFQFKLQCMQRTKGHPRVWE